MDNVISEYLLSHTLEQVTNDWNEAKCLSSRDNYKGWINYIINNRKEPICEILWMITAKYLCNDTVLQNRLVIGNDQESFSSLKDKLFNEIIKDSEWLNMLYKSGKKSEKQEKFRNDRSKFYL